MILQGLDQFLCMIFPRNHFLSAQCKKFTVNWGWPVRPIGQIYGLNANFMGYGVKLRAEKIQNFTKKLTKNSNFAIFQN